MRICLSLCLALLVLAACAAPPPPPPPVSAAARIEGHWLGIRVSAPELLEMAQLTDPEGRAYRAIRILPAAAPPPAEDRGPGMGRPSVILGGSGGSSSGMDAGIGLSLPIQNPFGGRPAPARPRFVVSQAEFELPLEALGRYRSAGGQGWSLTLVYGPANQTIAAPPPEIAGQ